MDSSKCPEHGTAAWPHTLSLLDLSKHGQTSHSLCSSATVTLPIFYSYVDDIVLTASSSDLLRSIIEKIWERCITFFGFLSKATPQGSSYLNNNMHVIVWTMMAVCHANLAPLWLTPIPSSLLKHDLLLPMPFSTVALQEFCSTSHSLALTFLTSCNKYAFICMIHKTFISLP